MVWQFPLGLTLSTTSLLHLQRRTPYHCICCSFQGRFWDFQTRGHSQQRPSMCFQRSHFTMLSLAFFENFFAKAVWAPTQGMVQGCWHHNFDILFGAPLCQDPFRWSRSRACNLHRIDSGMPAGIEQFFQDPLQVFTLAHWWWAGCCDWLLARFARKLQEGGRVQFQGLEADPIQIPAEVPHAVWSPIRTDFQQTAWRGVTESIGIQLPNGWGFCWQIGSDEPAGCIEDGARENIAEVQDGSGLCVVTRCAQVRVMTQLCVIFFFDHIFTRGTTQWCRAGELQMPTSEEKRWKCEIGEEIAKMAKFRLFEKLPLLWKWRPKLPLSSVPLFFLQLGFLGMYNKYRNVLLYNHANIPIIFKISINYASRTELHGKNRKLSPSHAVTWPPCGNVIETCRKHDAKVWRSGRIVGIARWAFDALCQWPPDLPGLVLSVERAWFNWHWKIGESVQKQITNY